MAFIDIAYIDGAIGQPMREQLTSQDLTVAAQLILAADTRAQQDLKQAGYTAEPGDYTPATASKIVQHVSLGYFIRMGFVRRNLKIPEDLKVYTDAGDRVATGKLMPDGLTPDPSDAVGGTTFTNSDVSISGGIPPQFSIPKLNSW